MPTWNLTIGDIKSITFDNAQEVSMLSGTVKLVSLKIQKELYVPGHIEAILQIVPKDGVKVSDIAEDYLLGQFVTLKDDTRYVATNYIVFECQPKYKPEKEEEENNQASEEQEQKKQTSLYVTLDIYSPEHCLTFKKYNKCYVAKKLGEDIFKTIAKENSSQIQICFCGSLQRLSLKNADGENMEFIQPYLVQYNETALDFLNRVANECGVFLYYESGTWYLESNVDKPTKKMGEYESLTFKKLTTQEEGTADEGLAIGTKEEYMDTLTESINVYTQAELQKRMGLTKFDGWLFNISNWAKKANIVEILTSIAFDAAKQGAKAYWKLNDQSEKWNEKHIKPYENNTEQCTKVDGKKVVCQFSNYNAKSSFGSSFYEKVRKEEITASKKKMHINYDTHYQSLLLREVFEYNGKKYYVSKVSYTKDNMVESTTAYEHLEVDAIPLSNNEAYPPLLERKSVNKIESQVGIVTANNDPGNMGRLQFRYSWQSTEEGKPSSPWVSIAQPFASDDAGIRFMPQEGDEIMIGYENGRMDRPFMIGGLATKTKKLDVSMNKIATVENATPNSYLDDSNSGYFNNDFILKSPSGQYIKFLVPSNANYLNALTTFLPCVKTFLSYAPASKDSYTYSTEDGQKFSGGINIGDAYGFFNINLSTEKRKVLISSAMGDVQIDAFTGITISAPNGNVKIEGKNVEIAAGNNLTLKSGTNVDKMNKFFSKQNIGYAASAGFTNAVVSEIKSHVKLVDVRLLRTLFDSVFKPVGGTLLIKSKRFLRLEAGKGSTTLPKGAFNNGSKSQKKILEAEISNMKVKDTVDAAKKLMDWYENTFASAVPNLKALMNNYETLRTTFLTKLRKFKADGGTVQYDGRNLEPNDINDNLVKKAKDLFVDVKDNGQEAVDRFTEDLSKISFSNNNPVTNIGEVSGFKRDCVKDGERFVKATLEYFQSLENKAKNADGFVQYHIIDISNRQLLTMSSMSYKNEIFSLLSKEVGGNAGDIDTNQEHAIKKNVDPTGVRLKIHNVFANALNSFNLARHDKLIFDLVTKRKMIWYVLQVLKEAKLITIDNNDGLWHKLTTGQNEGTKVALNNDNVCETTEKWKDFLKCVKTYQGGVATTFWNYFDKVDGFGFKDFTDLYRNWDSETTLYNPDIKGEILLSDTSGHTCKIENEGISAQYNDKIKSTIKDLETLSENRRN